MQPRLNSWTGHCQISLLIIIGSLNSKKFSHLEFHFHSKWFFLFSVFSVDAASSINFIDFPVTLITLQSFQERSQFHLNKLIIKGVKIIQWCEAETFRSRFFFLTLLADSMGKLIKSLLSLFPIRHLSKAKGKMWSQSRAMIIFIHPCANREMKEKKAKKKALRDKWMEVAISSDIKDISVASLRQPRTAACSLVKVHLISFTAVFKRSDEKNK